jgi:subtilisin family serine protease
MGLLGEPEGRDAMTNPKGWDVVEASPLESSADAAGEWAVDAAMAEEGALYVVQTGDSVCPWGLDFSETDEGKVIFDLWGTTIIPMPIGPVSRAEAVRFAEGTPAGQKHGVRR